MMSRHQGRRDHRALAVLLRIGLLIGYLVFLNVAATQVIAH